MSTIFSSTAIALRSMNSALFFRLKNTIVCADCRKTVLDWIGLMGTSCELTRFYCSKLARIIVKTCWAMKTPNSPKNLCVPPPSLATKPYLALYNHPPW